MRFRLEAQLAGLLWTGCGPSPPESTPRAPPDILVVALDTVRFDHTSLSGYARDTTPNLAALAALAALPGSVTFSRAYTDAAWSLPAYVSLFTGQHALSHGVGFRAVQLPPGQPTLASMLQAYGFATRAFVSGPHLAPDSGIGFDEYNHFPGARTIGAQVDKVVEWMSEPADTPRFAFVHGYDAHSPYPTPAVLSDLYNAHPRTEVEVCRAPTWRCRTGHQPRRVGPPMEDVAAHQLGATYDAAVTFADLQLGRILYALQAAGRLDDMVVVVLSDHGEMLGEGGGQGHQHGFDDRVFQVPLVVRVPDAMPARTVSRVVSLSDLLPTLAARLHMTPPSYSEGRAIPELLEEKGPGEAHPHRAASKCCIYVREGEWWLSGVQEDDAMSWTLRRDGDARAYNDEEPARLDAMRAVVQGWPEALGSPDAMTRAIGASDPALKKALQEGGYWPAETP